MNTRIIPASICRLFLRPSKRFLVVVTLSFFWILYVITAHLDIQEKQLDNGYLREKLAKLSKEYGRILANELNNRNGDAGVQISNEQDVKQITIILLQNMMDRLQLLEKRLNNRVLENNQEKQFFSDQIRSLNHSIYKTLKSQAQEEHCSIPNDPLYPGCADKIEWLKRNWKRDIKYSQNGVDGTMCSFIKYLSEVEDFCHGLTNGAKKHNCEVPVNPDFPMCKDRVLWIVQNWQKDKKYSDLGVDGSLCSILFYLSEVESKCPSLYNKSVSPENDCKVPKDDRYPHCKTKVDWMKAFWRSHHCYAHDYGVDGSVCSLLDYLSNVEQFCPKQANRSTITATMANTNTLKVNIDKTSKGKLLDQLSSGLHALLLEWVGSRIARMYTDWHDGVVQLKSRVNISGNVQKKILIHVGVLGEEKSLHFAETAGKGGPLGELVQWSDLITSLYVLGHDIQVTANHEEFLSHLSVPRNRPCPPTAIARFDLVFTDYYGLRYLKKKSMASLGFLRCKLRLLDSFGTEAQFNNGGILTRFSSPDGATFAKTTFGGNNLKLKQYMTMFPHSPDNSFLGFVVGSKVEPVSVKKKPQALVYGKHYYMWKHLKNFRFLDIIHEHFEIHATTGGASLVEIQKYLPPYVINHGLLEADKFLTLLRESQLFIGLGFPYEGPAALEAIAQGCIYLNPKFVPPKSQVNTNFFKGKPTFRALTSQHPYAEEFIGEPHVFTVDIMDENAVRDAMKKINNTKVDPYLPFEYTHEGMLERVNAFLENENLCGPPNNWPPLSSRKVYTATRGESCKDTCLAKGLVCEPAYFPSINNVDYIKKTTLPCDIRKVTKRPSLVAPAYIDDEKLCVLQNNPDLYSCTVSNRLVQRICPCRDYRIGQVALCSTCF